MRKLLTVLVLLALCLPLIAQAEVLSYADEQMKLRFDLPEGWTQTGDSPVTFEAPDGSGVVYVVPSDYPVTPEMVEALNEETVIELLQLQGGETFTDFQTLMYARATDDDGNLYLIAACGCMVEGVPHIYAAYLFTDAGGMLGSVISLSVNNDAGASTRTWYEEMLAENIPDDITQKLLGVGE